MKVHGKCPWEVGNKEVAIVADLLLFDGNNLLFRAYYSRPVQADFRGQFHAVTGLIDMVIGRYLAWKPKQIVVAWDAPGKTFRHEIFPAYKVNRKPPPEELLSQIPRVKKALNNLGVAQVEMEGFEADDLIGTLANQAEQEGRSAIIVSGDRDFWQLITRNVAVEYLRVKKSRQMLTLNRFRELYKIDPQQILDLKAIAGDHTDNIPGVPGIGEKTVWPLLQQGVGFKELLEFPGLLTPRQAKQMEKYKDQALLSRKLGEIRKDVPIQWQTGTINLSNELSKKTLQALGLRRLIAS